VNDEICFPTVLMKKKPLLLYLMKEPADLVKEILLAMKCYNTHFLSTSMESG
jgi:hypothetical protein